MVAAWAWSHRYALMEDYAADRFADAGFEVELDIVSVTDTQAQLSNIRLTREGQDVLTINKLQAEYVWPDIRDLRTEGLKLQGARTRLSLGEDWRPADDWINDLLANGAGAGRGNKISFPENGISLTDSVVTLAAPFGEAELFFNAEIPTLENFTSEVILQPTDLSYAGYSAKGSAGITLAGSMSGGSLQDLTLEGQARTDRLSNGALSIEDANLSFAGNLDIGARLFEGDMSVDGQAVSSDLFAADAAQLSWTGRLSKADELRAAGRWSVSTDEARIPRAKRAEELAETLSLFPAISVVPVTENFAPELKQTVKSFLLGSDVTVNGALDYGPSGFTITPDGVVDIQNQGNRLRLVPRDGATFFNFDAKKKIISARLDAQFDDPVGLTLTDIQLQAKSENGVKLGGIQSFSAKFETFEDWLAKAEDGRPVRLRPVTASLNYKGGSRRPRQLTINTSVDYDGDLPGGRVTGLNLEGRLDVHLYVGRQVLDFTPTPSSRVTLVSLETPTAWFGEDISFSLPPTTSLFTREKGQSNFTATLEMADFTLTQPAIAGNKAQRLDFQSEGLTLDGTLWPDKTQDWNIDFTQVQYASETLPGAGTIGFAPRAKVTTRLSPGQSPQLTLNSSSITAETPLVRISDFEIALSGTPDAYVVDHQGGTVDVIGSEFADTAKKAGLGRFPANGRVEFKDGKYIGRSKLVVAKANNADVDVSYEYADGAGTALIEIPSILFEPKGLQPQTLVPALRGKIARVEGEARAALNIGFADGALTSSSGTVQLVDMAVGTAPGPIMGLNTTMAFSSLFPLETNGPQTLTMESFNPGMDLKDGTVSFHLVPDGVKVDSADWPIGNGSFSLDPFIWQYYAPENRVVMRVKNVSLGDFLNNVGNKKIQATGNVVGVFPIVVRGVDVLIEKGEVSVPEGGLIKYDPGPNVPRYSQEEAIDVLRERRAGEYAFLAQDALREFRYRELSASLNGPLDGDVEIGLIFDGSNKKVLNQQPFRFDISVKGELFNIARSFNSNAQVKSEILRQNGSLPEGTVIGE